MVFGAVDDVAPSLGIVPKMTSVSCAMAKLPMHVAVWQGDDDVAEERFCPGHVDRRAVGGEEVMGGSRRLMNGCGQIMIHQGALICGPGPQALRCIVRICQARAHAPLDDAPVPFCHCIGVAIVRD